MKGKGAEIDMRRHAVDGRRGAEKWNCGGRKYFLSACCYLQYSKEGETERERKKNVEAQLSSDKRRLAAAIIGKGG